MLFKNTKQQLMFARLVAKTHSQYANALQNATTTQKLMKRKNCFG